jgi:hypothetical protein
MTTLHKYTFTCTTEATEKSVWRDEDDPVPSKCPDDTSHTIDTTSIRITDTVEETTTTIREELIPTGGHFRAMCKSIDIGANETKIDDNTWPYNISALAIEFITTSENQGDDLELIVGPDTIIGAITSGVSISDNVINVDQTTIDYIDIGFRVNLFDGVNTEELGHVTSIDKDNKTITTENSSTTAFLASSPTYVRINVNVIDDYTIGAPGRWIIGEAKIGGSHVKAGISVRIIYKNNTASAKNFTAQLEYLY